MSKIFIFFAVLSSFAVASASPLRDLYTKAVKKNEDAAANLLRELIKSSVPYGIEKSNPKIAEYETFQQSASANFIHDGLGHLHFRQFRRINLNDAIHHS